MAYFFLRNALQGAGNYSIGLRPPKEIPDLAREGPVGFALQLAITARRMRRGRFIPYSRLCHYLPQKDTKKILYIET